MTASMLAPPASVGAQSAALLQALREALGTDGVLTAPDDTTPFLEDWRGVYRGDALCVARPRDTAQVAMVVRLCAQHGTPLVPQGGNTSLCGGAVPDAGSAGVVLSLARLRRIRSLDAASNVIEVEAGCVLQEVQEAARRAGRLYPVSLGAEGSCQIGGTIATNAGGTSVLRYGNTRDNVLGLEVVLANGDVWNGLYRLRKNNTGLDLKHLFIGTEGTLGIITAATLKLHPLPRTQTVGWVGLGGPEAAVQLLGICQARCGAALSAFEMIDAGQLHKVIQHVPDRRSPLGGEHAWHVLIELSEASDTDLTPMLEQALAEAVEQGWVDDAVIAVSGAQRDALWAVRHSVSEANKKAGVSVSMDTAVPLSAVPAFIERGTQAVRRLVPGLEVLTVAHLGDGNVHFIPFFRVEQWKGLADAPAVALAIRERVNTIAHELGGTFSAEHGVGRTHRDEMAMFKSSVELALMRQVKATLDPAGLFNPGRLLPEPSEASLEARST